MTVGELIAELQKLEADKRIGIALKYFDTYFDPDFLNEIEKVKIKEVSEYHEGEDGEEEVYAIKLFFD